jgi:gp32 DNA binding protein like
MSKPKFDKSMFSKIKDVLDKTKSGGNSQYENIMKFKAGHTYVLRLLPLTEEGKDPLFHYYVHQWTSPVTGKFASALSLQTFGDRDPIAEYRWKQFKAWKDSNPTTENKEYKGNINQKEQWLINVLVIDNPENPEMNGEVKILRMGPQLKAIIDDATEGEKSEELGWDVFDPTAGYDFKIVAKAKGDFTSFETSFFSTKTKKKIGEDEVEEIYEKLHDLTTVETVRTYDELKDLLEEHFGGAEEEKEERKPLGTVKKDSKKSKEEDIRSTKDFEEDEIPMEHSTDTTDEDIDELLAGLD